MRFKFAVTKKEDKGDDCVEQLYHTYQDSFYRYSYYLTGNRQKAEDGVQAMWMTALANREVLAGMTTEAEREQWLRRALRSEVRQQKRKEQRNVPLEEAEGLPAQATSRIEEIYGIIRDMPENYGPLLEMYFILQLEPKEIAQRLGLSMTALYTRLHRGRSLLREKLREEGYHG